MSSINQIVLHDEKASIRSQPKTHASVAKFRGKKTKEREREEGERERSRERDDGKEMNRTRTMY